MGSRFSRLSKSPVSTSIGQRRARYNIERRARARPSDFLVRAIVCDWFQSRVGDRQHSSDVRDNRTVLRGPLPLPQHVAFADLQLERETVTGRLLYLPEPLSEVIRCNGDDPLCVLADEDLAMWYIAEWYFAHRLAGGDPDPVAEHIISHVVLTERHAEH
jgi:hypothetical protein